MRLSFTFSLRDEVAPHWFGHRDHLDALLRHAPYDALTIYQWDIGGVRVARCEPIA
jgi:hypothetical protein